MFENLIAQPAAALLMDDLGASRLPPSILFSGPEASGKLTAALELARILSCAEGHALWSCTCGSCRRHKELTHPDLLIMGPRNSILEIRAASGAFLAKKTPATRYLFIRSIRKLTLRFNPELTGDDDTRAQKAVPLLSAINESLEEIDPSRPLPEDAALEKIVRSLVEDAEKIEMDFMYDSIPVSQVRNAASWARLSPSGKKKVLVVENADRMQEAARNAFLKVLEEPPADVAFILTTSRRGAIMPTILSRVRTYAFVERSSESQAEVIARVFHDSPHKGESLAAFFYRFLPVPLDTISMAADTFLRMVLVDAIDAGRKPLAGLKTVLDATGDQQGSKNSSDGATLASLVAMLNKCKPSIVWRLFLACVAQRMRLALRSDATDARESAIYLAWTHSVRDALEAVSVYNIGPQAALESLFSRMRESV